MASFVSKQKTVRLALIGGDTLLGRELEEVMSSRGRGVQITKYASGAEGSFGEQEGEAVLLKPLNAESVGDTEAILTAGSSEGAFQAYEIAKSGGGRPVLIDCTGHLENQPETRIFAPLLEEPDVRKGWLFVIAHPAASALGAVLKRLGRYRRIRQSVVNVFEPASERGKRGIAELHQQTSGLLSFKPLEKGVFDAQLSFNLLSQYGEDAPAKLSHVEQRIERDLATILSRDVNGTQIAMPSLRVVQAPVFHGYSLSMWVEFESDAAVDALREALASAQIEVRGQDETAPENASAAGQSGVVAGDIRMDRNNGRAAWLWIVADNLRLTADAAADLVSALATERK